MKLQNCSFRSFKWANGEFIYTCTVNSAAINKPGTEISEFIGHHVPGITNTDVKGLLLNDGRNVVNYFPRSVDKIYPRLTHVTMINCGLKEIANADLKGFANLKYLNLSANKLTALPDDLFKGMNKLKWIRMQDNLIETMTSQLLIPIKDNDLQLINFKGNKSINEFYKTGEHNTLKNLMASIDQKCAPAVAFEQQAEQSFRSLRPMDKPSQDWLQNIEQLFTSGDLSDFTIKVCGKEYKVHKNILAAQSSVFKKLFTEKFHDLKEVKGFTETAFEEFLAYFYTGVVKSKENACDLFELAAEFIVADLKSLSEELILENLSELNWLEVYNLGSSYASEVLKKAAFAKIKKIFPELDDSSIDDTDLVNNLMNGKHGLEELCSAAANKSEA